MSTLNPLVHAVIAHFDSVFEGPNGDYSAVLETVAGVSVSQALWKPALAQNSIWQIVEHLIASTEWQIEVLKNGDATSPEWVQPSGDEALWQASLDRLKDAHRRLKLVLEQLSDADLLKIPASEQRCTLLELLLSSGPAHEAHHGGQIDYLRGLHANKQAGK